MSKSDAKPDLAYNQRLFKGGVRKWVHHARFTWAAHVLAQMETDDLSVVELGCFDGRMIDFIPHPIRKYVGFDAGWEGGLDSAMDRFRGSDKISFHKCTVPEDFNAASDSADVVLALETMEHIPPELVDGYIEEVYRVLKREGRFIVSIPNEMGIVFLVKFFFKNMCTRDGAEYTFPEVLWASLGQMHKVERNDHKGFSWKALRAQIQRRFTLVDTCGIQLPSLPASMNVSVGLVFTKR